MFTGLIQAVGAVESVEESPSGRVLRLNSGDWSYQPQPGDSVAINGCCLTVVSYEQGTLAFDVVHQTLKMTTLGDLKPGSSVNLEHAATPDTLLGGHIVQGHVDGVALAARVDSPLGEVRIRVTPPAHLLPFIPPKGSICVDGVSLTVADIGDGWFEIALIPTTLEKTTLGLIADSPVRVNLETDCLVKAVVHYMESIQLPG